MVRSPPSNVNGILTRESARWAKKAGSPVLRSAKNLWCLRACPVWTSLGTRNRLYEFACVLHGFRIRNFQLRSVHLCDGFLYIFMHFPFETSNSNPSTFVNLLAWVISSWAMFTDGRILRFISIGFNSSGSNDSFYTYALEVVKDLMIPSRKKWVLTVANETRIKMFSKEDIFNII